MIYIKCGVSFHNHFDFCSYYYALKESSFYAIISALQYIESIVLKQSFVRKAGNV